MISFFFFFINVVPTKTNQPSSKRASILTCAQDFSARERGGKILTQEVLRRVRFVIRFLGKVVYLFTHPFEVSCWRENKQTEKREFRRVHMRRHRARPTAGQQTAAADLAKKKKKKKKKKKTHLKPPANHFEDKQLNWLLNKIVGLGHLKGEDGQWTLFSGHSSH